MSETKKTQHTPGPWRASSQCIVEPTNATVAITMANACDSVEQRDANARLIAAAPDLLEALKDLLDRAERQAAGMLVEASCEVWYAHRDAARAAIAKAGGK